MYLGGGGATGIYKRLVARMNFRVASMSRLLTSGGNLSLPYRMNSTNNSFERSEMTLGGEIS